VRCQFFPPPAAQTNTAVYVSKPVKIQNTTSLIL
jgi:hypothetical protein